jgi:YD repeat-containing protein
LATNEIGNLIWKGSTSNPLSYPPSGANSVRPHAVSSFNANYYTYDANGSLTARGNQIITYDARRLPVRLDELNGTTVWRTAYDGDGIRRKRLDADGTVH